MSFFTKEVCFFVHMFSCAFMLGLIWLIQVVHYPGFAFAQTDEFTNFMLFHGQKITWIVGPIMLLELVSGVYIAMQYFNHRHSYLIVINLIGLVLIWISTALLSIPLHEQLSHGYDAGIISSLVITNWPRTILWSVRFCVLGFVLIKNFKLK